MKRLHYIFILVVISSLLAGCTSVSKEKVDVQITGDTQYNPNLKRVHVAGKSNLEAGTILTLFVEGEEFERDIKVAPRGYFKTMFIRDNSIEGQLIIRLDPRKQTKELQEKYGERGENLQGTLVEYEENGNTYKTIEAYSLLSKVAEEIWDQKGGVQEVLYNGCSRQDCK
ncbi:hypothetical protein FZW96_13515 [Bacillus sp. BGMRC 2118]|nr:hypothetical protein FZW96_13515 [Bacillus sp. BGMRC 2118]